MNKFIAAMDHSGGSTGSVLERYGQDYTEENKMDLVHAMRLRMINSPDFNSDNICAAILYKDSVERGIVPVLNAKGIDAFIKIDSGCNEDGTLKKFSVNEMISYAKQHGCVGTKMRSIVKEMMMIDIVLDQQFNLATAISDAGLIPIIEPEIPIDHPSKAALEEALLLRLKAFLDRFHGKCILKLTLPEKPNLYHLLPSYTNVYKLVGLSGGYSTYEACSRLSKNKDMSASFSRALSENLYIYLTEAKFNDTMSNNINMIVKASQ